MKNVLILHGTNGSSQGNWFPWLKIELERKGVKVWVPDLPLADKPDIQRYNKYIFKHWQLNKDSIIIGHSSGAVAVLGLLQYLPKALRIEKAILVAGFKNDLGRKDLSQLFLKPFDFEKIKTHCKDFKLIHSNNDSYVPLKHGQFLADKLNGEIIILKDQKHFNISSMGDAYKQFFKILEYI